MAKIKGRRQVRKAKGLRQSPLVVPEDIKAAAALPEPPPEVKLQTSVVAVEEPDTETHNATDEAVMGIGVFL